MTHQEGDALSPHEHAVLAFERRWWRYGGAKDLAVRERLGISSAQYYRTLNGLLDRPAALATDPLLVKRLRRQRSTRQLRRSAARVGDAQTTRRSG